MTNWENKGQMKTISTHVFVKLLKSNSLLTTLVYLFISYECKLKMASLTQIIRNRQKHRVNFNLSRSVYGLVMQTILYDNKRKLNIILSIPKAVGIQDIIRS